MNKLNIVEKPIIEEVINSIDGRKIFYIDASDMSSKEAKFWHTLYCSVEKHESINNQETHLNDIVEFLDVSFGGFYEIKSNML